MKIKDVLRKKIGTSIKGRVYFDQPLGDCTSFRIGGPARVWIEPADLEDLRRAVFISRRIRLPLFLFGNGSNLLVGDKAVEKTVIRLSSPFFKGTEFCNNRVVCGSGVTLSSLIKTSMRKGLGNLEFLAGVPGTVGGAVSMNAGGPEEAIGKYVQQVTVMDYRGRLKDLKKEELRFGYRKSNLAGKVILQVAFRLKKADTRLIKKRFNKLLDNKKRTQELKFPSAGCVFKNPGSTKWTTGQLLELSGIKGKRIGDAKFSERHANFIVNLGKATFRDVRTLMRLAQREVKKRFGLCLEPEIKIVV